MLQDSVSRLSDAHRDVASRPKDWEGGASRAAIERAMVEMGLFALTFAEEDEGLAQGPVEVGIVAEALGPALLASAWIAGPVHAGAALRLGGSPAQRGAILPGVAMGETRLALAWGDRATAVPALTASPGATGWILEGSCPRVPGGDCADMLIVGARCPEGVSRLFLVPTDASGVSRRSFLLHGGGTAADVSLSAVAISPGAVLPCDALDVVGRAEQASIAAMAAEAVGIMAASLDMTVDYLKTRTQFGAAIGTNQALQHHAAEMMVELEQARSAALFAAMMLDDPDANERARASAAAKIVINRSASVVAKGSVQLHGGIGVSDEHPVAHYLRRLTAIQLLFGDTAEHIVTLARLAV